MTSASLSLLFVPVECQNKIMRFGYLGKDDERYGILLWLWTGEALKKTQGGRKC